MEVENILWRRIHRYRSVHGKFSYVKVDDKVRKKVPCSEFKGWLSTFEVKIVIDGVRIFQNLSCIKGDKGRGLNSMNSTTFIGYRIECHIL